MAPPDAAIEADLAAFMEGQLNPDRAFAVAEYLAARPERAAALLAEATTVAGLRLALAVPATPPPAPLMAEARRLQSVLRRRQTVRRYAPPVAALVLFAAGWLGEDLIEPLVGGDVPPIVEAALDAQAALDRRHDMASQPETAALDPGEIVAALGVDVPALPTDWIVRDVQVVATPERPGVAIVLDTLDLGRVMLFAVGGTDGAAAQAADAFEYEGKSVAVFERGRSRYVLVDNAGSPDALSRSADRLIN